MTTFIAVKDDGTRVPLNVEPFVLLPGNTMTYRSHICGRDGNREIDLNLDIDAVLIERHPGVQRTELHAAILHLGFVKVEQP